MAKFIIQPHGRLQEAVAHELGFFADEGLDTEISGGDADRPRNPDPETGKAREVRSGAYQSYEAGKGNKGEARSDISCACHWTVNNAAANGLGAMVGGAYVVTPGGIMVPEDSDIRAPEDLAGREIAVGYQSGSHYTTIQALEPFMARDDIRLKFMGLPWQRVDVAHDGELPAASLWGIAYQVAEGLGMRRVADCTFMITFMFPDGVDPADVEKYFNALKRAQMELDLRPEPYKHHFAAMIPERYRDRVDVRRFCVGERIVFLPYTRETFARTQAWIHERKIFDDIPDYDYDMVVAG